MHDSGSIRSDPVYARVYISCRLATQLGTYAKFTPKQKATTPTISSVTLANWPCRYLAI